MKARYYNPTHLPTLGELRETLAELPTMRGWRLGLGVEYRGLGDQIEATPEPRHAHYGRPWPRLAAEARAAAHAKRAARAHRAAVARAWAMTRKACEHFTVSPAAAIAALLMPKAPPHPCASCGRLVLGRCQACERKREQARGSATARGYDSVWAAYARQWLRTYPYCGQRLDGHFYSTDSECTARNERQAAECVDHIRPLRAGGARLDPWNLQSLCTRCNARKAYRQNREVPT